MDDLISRQAAIDALDRIFDNVPMELTTEILRLRRELRGLPPADVVEVVRCKDCKWFDACVNGNVFKILDVEDYCSYGEKGEKKDGQ